MCLAPILIDNPYYKSPVKDKNFHIIHDTVNAKIPVPCGRCASCIYLKQMYIVQRVQMEALNNDLFYGTLTYNQSSLPRAYFKDFSFAYPDFSDWQKMIKMIRKDFPELKFKYLLVSEYGGEKHRPHFHFLLSIPRSSDLLAEKWSKANELFNIFLKYWRRNYGSCRNPIWKPLCTYVRRGDKFNYDLHWLDPSSSKDGLDGVSFYVTKYILKYDDWIDKFKSKLFFELPPEDYKYAWSLFRPRCLFSKFFGSPYDIDVQSHIIKGINFALNTTSAFFPYYISCQNGSTYPLSPYYSKRFLSPSSQLVFALRRPSDDFIDSHEFDKRQAKLLDVKSYLHRQSNEIDFLDIDSINDINFIDYAEPSRFYRSNQDIASDWEDF